METPLLWNDRDCMGQVPWGSEKSVHWLAVDSTVASLSADRMGIMLSRVAGPALLLAWVSLKGVLALWISTPVLAFLSASCGSGMAHIPPWLFPTLGLGLVGLLALEFRVLRVVLPIYARRISASSFATFEQWLVFYMGLSLVSHADLVTNGVFLARALFVDANCAARSRFPDLWAHAMRTSALPMLAGVPFSALVLLGWALMALQFLRCLLRSLPRTSTDVKGAPLQYGLGQKSGYYSTWGQESTNNAYVLKDVAETSRMSAVVAAVVATGRAEVELMTQNIPMAYGNLLRSSIARVTLMLLLESAFQLNVQSSGLALAKATDDEHAIDKMTLFSIALGLLMAARYIVRELQNANFYYRKVRGTDIREELGKFLRGQFEDWSEEDSASLNEVLQLGCPRARATHVQGLAVFDRIPLVRRNSIVDSAHACAAGLKEQRLVGRRYFKFVAVLSLYVCLVSRAAFQTAMAVYCEHGLHNIGKGCVCEPGFHVVGRTCVGDGNATTPPSI